MNIKDVIVYERHDEEYPLSLIAPFALNLRMNRKDVLELYKLCTEALLYRNHEYEYEVE